LIAEKKSLLLLLGPGMSLTWVCTGLVIWNFFPVDFPQAMVIAGCLAPTDPIVCNNIISGKFAETNIPQDLQHLLLAESSTNDGLGYPFLYAALYYIRYLQHDTQFATAAQEWIGKVCLWTIILSIVYGALAGYLARITLEYASKQGFVDRESFIFMPVALALLVMGTCGILNTDDVLSAFIAGCSLNWNEW
jgi:sodium/hydrogen antiporter